MPADQGFSLGQIVRDLAEPQDRIEHGQNGHYRYGDRYHVDHLGGCNRYNKSIRSQDLIGFTLLI
jgi:hypothetical protein